MQGLLDPLLVVLLLVLAVLEDGLPLSLHQLQAAPQKGFGRQVSTSARGHNSVSLSSTCIRFFISPIALKTEPRSRNSEPSLSASIFSTVVQNYRVLVLK